MTTSPPLRPTRRKSNATARQLFRFRWVVAAALFAAAAAVAIDALSPTTVAMTPALVASQDLNAGDRLSEANTSIVEFPPNLIPEDAHLNFDAARDRVVIHSVARGTVLGTHVAPPLGTIPTGPPGTVVTPVRFADPATAALVGPGTRVDVLAAMPHVTDDLGIATVVASGAVVVADTPTAGTGLLDTQPPDNRPVLLAVSPAEATALAGASGRATFSIVILPTGTG